MRGRYKEPRCPKVLNQIHYFEISESQLPREKPQGKRLHAGRAATRVPKDMCDFTIGFSDFGPPPWGAPHERPKSFQEGGFYIRNTQQPRRPTKSQSCCWFCFWFCSQISNQDGYEEPRGFQSTQSIWFCWNHLIRVITGFTKSRQCPKVLNRIDFVAMNRSE